MLVLWLFWLVTAVAGQPLTSPDGGCKAGWECRKEYNCRPYLELKDLVKRLKEASEKDKDVGAEYQKQSDRLKELVCNVADEGVCCKKQLEIVNGNIVKRVQDMPFIVRLHLKTDVASWGTCGASLINNLFLLTAKHCLTKFTDSCTFDEDCTAHFRDLRPDHHEQGEFSISIWEVYKADEKSDLAVVELKHPVEEHPDYKLGVPLQPIKLASENPKHGEKVYTGGWGLIGRG